MLDPMDHTLSNGLWFPFLLATRSGACSCNFEAATDCVDRFGALVIMARV
jgi:hypothetical protein